LSFALQAVTASASTLDSFGEVAGDAMVTTCESPTDVTRPDPGAGAGEAPDAEDPTPQVDNGPIVGVAPQAGSEPSGGDAPRAPDATDS
jgi:hypothetical protein